MSSDLKALRDYVTYDTGSLNKAETTVLLNVTHSNLKAMFMELRFDLHVRFSVHCVQSNCHEKRRRSSCSLVMCTHICLSTCEQSEGGLRLSCKSILATALR